MSRTRRPSAIGHLRLLQACVLLLCLWVAGPTQANNIQVSNTTLTDANVAGGFVKVQFDLSWENSWRHPFGTGINNWDAAWVFVKYRTPVSVGGDGLWKHARLNDTGHEPGDGMTADAGLLTPGTAYDATTNPALGVFIYRSGPGRGDINLTGVRLRWNYGQNDLESTDLIEIRVFAVEMVYVPQGTFFLGSGGTESGRFIAGNTTNEPYQITSEAALIIGNDTGQLWGASTSGNNSIGPAGGVSAAFPKGYAAFYMMKYSITQQQYVDFLNMLTRSQQESRFPSTTVGRYMHLSDVQVTPANRNGVRLMSDPGDMVPRIYGCDLNVNNIVGEVNDGQWIAMNWIRWSDGAAFLDWAGLRPMTELEYEKAARGPLEPISNEYVWGNTSATPADEISNAARADETTAPPGANAVFANRTNVQGPVRVGAMPGAATTRAQAGAAFYGIMEMSGNLWERAVSIGNSTGRDFTGSHGDGALSINGHANPTTWPGLVDGQITDAFGSGFRGGAWLHVPEDMRLSDRAFASSVDDARRQHYGFRGVRSAGCVDVIAAPTFDTSNGLSPSTASAGQLLTYRVIGSGSYLWVVPNDWQIVSGQGTNEITVIAGPAPAAIRVAALGACGAGTVTARIIIGTL